MVDWALVSGEITIGPYQPLVGNWTRQFRNLHTNGAAAHIRDTQISPRPSPSQLHFISPASLCVSVAARRPRSFRRLPHWIAVCSRSRSAAMIPTVRGMSAVSALRRLATSRLAQSGSLPNTLLLRTLSTRILAPKALQLTATPVLGGPISPLSTVDFCAREYATATKTRKSTTTKKTTAKKKKPAAKKKKPAAKKQKPAAKKKKPAPKKKKTAAKKKPVAKKKPKKKVAKPKVTRPKMTKFPPKHGIHGFSVYVKENFQSVTGATAPEKMSRVAAQWRALSEGEKAVCRPSAPNFPFACSAVVCSADGVSEVRLTMSER